MILFTKSFVIDLGTSTTQVYKRGEGVVLDEPSIVAVDRLGGKILAVGNSAKAMAEKTPDSVIIINPLLCGVVSDYEMTRSMLKNFFMKCPQGLTKPHVTVIASSAASDVEKRAVKEAFMGAGAKSVVFVNRKWKILQFFSVPEMYMPPYIRAFYRYLYRKEQPSCTIKTPCRRIRFRKSWPLPRNCWPRSTAT